MVVTPEACAFGSTIGAPEALFGLWPSNGDIGKEGLDLGLDDGAGDHIARSGARNDAMQSAGRPLGVG